MRQTILPWFLTFQEHYKPRNVPKFFSCLQNRDYVYGNCAQLNLLDHSKKCFLKKWTHDNACDPTWLDWEGELRLNGFLNLPDSISFFYKEFVLNK